MEVPSLIFGDLNPSVVEAAKKMNLGEEWVFGDPMSVPLHAIVSPANTLGEMSGGYDLVIRNKLGASVERRVMQNLAEEPRPPHLTPDKLVDLSAYSSSNTLTHSRIEDCINPYHSISCRNVRCNQVPHNA